MKMQVRQKVSHHANKRRRTLSSKRQGRPQPANLPAANPVAPIPPVRHPAADLRQVPLDAIDWSLAIRLINADHVDRLAGASRLPPIKVWEFKPGEYRGVDGYHRWSVARERGDENIVVALCNFPEGEEGKRAFDVECIRSNMGHGLPLTKTERNRAIRQFWSRWGRSSGRPEGQTLDDLGKLFALTKQRIHQILAGDYLEEAELRGQVFSSYGRFTAATKRMSTLLSDTSFLQRRIQDRQGDVYSALRDLHALIESVLRQNA